MLGHRLDITLTLSIHTGALLDRLECGSHKRGHGVSQRSAN